MGLDTKFHLIDYGIRARRYLAEQVGRDLMLRLLQVPQESVVRLHNFESSATNLRKLISTRAARLDDRSVDLTMDMLDNEIQLMRRVAAVDEVGALAGFEVPVRELVEIARLEFDRRRIRAVPDASPLKVAVEHFAGLQDGITRAFDALEWLRAASAVAMPAALLRRLSSPAAADEFARLKALTNRAAGPLGVYDGQVEMLGSKLGPVVYARSEPGVVSEEVAALLERKEELRELVGLRVLGFLNDARDFWREHRQTLETAKTREDESLAARERGHEAWATHVTTFPDVPMPHLSNDVWRERLLESRAMRDQLENSTLLSKTAEAEDAGRQLSEAFRNEFLSLLVHAFSKIRDTRDDLNRDMERHQFYGEKYVFRMTQVDRFSPIINLVQRATEDPNWTMPLLSMLGDETEEGLAIRTIADMIENNDEKGLSDLRDPKAYWTFDVLVKDPVTNATVSTMAARMKKGSIGEGSVPQYIAMAAAVSSKASSPDRNNGSLGVILLDDALSGLDAEHFVKMLKFISDAGLQIIAAAPDAQSREWAHGMDTFINVSREGNDIYLVHETVSDELREELAEADPRIKGYQAYRARTVERDRGDLMEVAE
jgi:hypothetical protein